MTDVTGVWAAIAGKLVDILAAHGAAWRRTALDPGQPAPSARNGRRGTACGDRVLYTLSVGDESLDWVHPEGACGDIEHDLTVLVLIASEAAQASGHIAGCRVMRDLVRLFGSDDARAIVQLALLAWQLALVEFDVYRVAIAYDEAFDGELSDDKAGDAFAEVAGHLDQIWLTRIDNSQARSLIASTLAALLALPI
jgi:hypothetical protein